MTCQVQTPYTPAKREISTQFASNMIALEDINPAERLGTHLMQQNFTPPFPTALAVLAPTRVFAQIRCVRRWIASLRALGAAATDSGGGAGGPFPAARPRRAHSGMPYPVSVIAPRTVIAWTAFGVRD
jgi:hypothetical protein